MNDQFRICFKLVESFLELWLVRCVKQEFNRGIRSSMYKCWREGGLEDIYQQYSVFEFLVPISRKKAAATVERPNFVSRNLSKMLVESGMKRKFTFRDEIWPFYGVFVHVLYD